MPPPFICSGKGTVSNFGFKRLELLFYYAPVMCWYIEVESRTQGSKPRSRTQKNPKPRPRTAFPRTDPLEANDRNAKGQGQGPRTQQQVFSKKKGLQKSFSGDLQFIGVARIFDWGGLNHKPHAMTSSKICLLALNQNFANVEGSN